MKQMQSLAFLVFSTIFLCGVFTALGASKDKPHAHQGVLNVSSMVPSSNIGSICYVYAYVSIGI